MGVDVSDIGNVVTLVLEPADHAEIHRRWSAVVKKIAGTDPILPKLAVIEHWGREERIVGRTTPVRPIKRGVCHDLSGSVIVVERMAEPAKRTRLRPRIVSLVCNHRLLW